MWCVLVFCLSFIQNYIATLEVYSIATIQPHRAAGLAVLNTLVAMTVVVLIVVDRGRLDLILSAAAGNGVATYTALKGKK